MSREKIDQQKQIDDLIAAQQRAIKRIVLSGGGAKGIVYPGAYRALLKSGVLAEITDVAGSSAGAITAALIAIGAPIEHIRKEATTRNIGSFLGARVKEQGHGVIRPVTKDGMELYNLIKAQIAHALSLIDIDELQSKLSPLNAEGLELLEQIRGPKEITFAQLHLLHQLYPTRFKNLTVTALEYPASRLQQFDYQHTPNVSIALACRASASIPIVLKPVEIEINGNKALYIDGGLENNLPTNLVSDPNHYEETLAFAFGEGQKADIYYGTDRVEHAIHRSHWSETIDLNFLKQFNQEVMANAYLPCDQKKLDTIIKRILKQRANLPYANPQHISPHTAKKLRPYLLEAAHEVYKTSSPSVDGLTNTCWALITKIKRPIYKPHALEYLGQNILPKYLLGLSMPERSTDKKYEDFRRIRDHFPLRTVDLHVGPIGTVDFKKATQLARVMDAVGYADTMGHILNHDLAKEDAHLDDYYERVDQDFVIIYRALLSGMGKNPEKDSFLKHWTRSVTAGNNQFEAIKSYVIKNPNSTVAFAFTRAIEYQDQLIDKNTLFKEIYVDAFKRQVFAKSTNLGATFFSSSSLEKALHKNPNLIPSIEQVVSQPRNNTRLNSIAYELRCLKPQNDPHSPEPSASNSP